MEETLRITATAKTVILNMISSTKTRYSDEFYFYTNDSIIGASLGLYGEYSQREINFLLNLIRPESIVYDIGGNIGYHATAFSSKAKKVYSFEPNLKNFELLKKNSNSFNNLEILNLAVGNDNGEIFVEDIDLSIPGNYGLVQISNSDGETVRIISLDEYKLEDPDFIKIDVEGFEGEVIKGALNLITRKKPIIYYEVQDHIQFKPDFKEIYNILTNLDYKLYWFAAFSFNPNNLNNITHNAWRGDNAVFSILALPSIFKELPLLKVESENDSYVKFSAEQ